MADLASFCCRLEKSFRSLKIPLCHNWFGRKLFIAINALNFIYLPVSREHCLAAMGTSHTFHYFSPPFLLCGLISTWKETRRVPFSKQPLLRSGHWLPHQGISRSWQNRRSRWPLPFHQTYEILFGQRLLWLAARGCRRKTLDLASFSTLARFEAARFCLTVHLLRTSCPIYRVPFFVVKNNGRVRTLLWIFSFPVFGGLKESLWTWHFPSPSSCPARIWTWSLFSCTPSPEGLQWKKVRKFLRLRRGKKTRVRNGMFVTHCLIFPCANKAWGV